MDNNILANKNWFYRLCKEVEGKFLVDFNQGLDIRLTDDDVAQHLAKLRPITCWKFAFDNMDYKNAVIEGIDTLNRNGVNVRNKVFFYVYVDSDKDFYDALQRCNILKQHGATPYVMLNQDVKHTRRMKELKRWCRPWIFWSIDIDQYGVMV